MATFLGQPVCPIYRLVISFCGTTWKPKSFENVRQAFIAPKNRISDINNAIPATMLLRVMGSLYSKYISASNLKDDT